MSFCPFSAYKNIFGEPKTGIHSFRIMDIAVLDVLAVVFIGFIIAYVGNFDLWKVLIVLFLSGILAHRLFCVRTTVDKWLFP